MAERELGYLVRLRASQVGGVSYALDIHGLEVGAWSLFQTKEHPAFMRSIELAGTWITQINAACIDTIARYGFQIEHAVLQIEGEKAVRALVTLGAKHTPGDRALVVEFT